MAEKIFFQFTTFILSIRRSANPESTHIPFVSLFKGISTFMDYLMSILLEKNSCDTF